METVTPAEFKDLDRLGEDPALQAESRTIIAEIASDSSIVPYYDWNVTAEFVTESAANFLKEMDIAHPVYSVFPEAVKVSFLSKNDGRHWQFALTKSAFLYIREVLASQKG